jgi:nanoRNase/pAp phosphatase (c-di-AMP/oligoRNAs hydrolase)
MLEKNPKFIIVLDQGSRLGPPVVDDPDVKSLVIDHHLSDEFPKGAIVSRIHAN